MPNLPRLSVIACYLATASGCSTTSFLCPPPLPRDNPVEAMAFEPDLRALPDGLDALPKEQAAQVLAETLAYDMDQFRRLLIDYRALVEWIGAE